jgi:hypothetical protein
MLSFGCSDQISKEPFAKNNKLDDKNYPVYINWLMLSVYPHLKVFTLSNFDCTYSKQQKSQKFFKTTKCNNKMKMKTILRTFIV